MANGSRDPCRNLPDRGFDRNSKFKIHQNLVFNMDKWLLKKTSVSIDVSNNQKSNSSSLNDQENVNIQKIDDEKKIVNEMELKAVTASEYFSNLTDNIEIIFDNNEKNHNHNNDTKPGELKIEVKNEEEARQKEIKHNLCQKLQNMNSTDYLPSVFMNRLPMLYNNLSTSPSSTRFKSRLIKKMGESKKTRFVTNRRCNPTERYIQAVCFRYDGEYFAVLDRSGLVSVHFFEDVLKRESESDDEIKENKDALHPEMSFRTGVSQTISSMLWCNIKDKDELLITYSSGKMALVFDLDYVDIDTPNISSPTYILKDQRKDGYKTTQYLFHTGTQKYRDWRLNDVRLVVIGTDGGSIRMWVLDSSGGGSLNKTLIPKWDTFAVPTKQNTNKENSIIDIVPLCSPIDGNNDTVEKDVDDIDSRSKALSTTWSEENGGTWFACITKSFKISVWNACDILPQSFGKNPAPVCLFQLDLMNLLVRSPTARFAHLAFAPPSLVNVNAMLLDVDTGPACMKVVLEYKHKTSLVHEGYGIVTVDLMGTQIKSYQHFPRPVTISTEAKSNTEDERDRVPDRRPTKVIRWDLMKTFVVGEYLDSKKYDGITGGYCVSWFSDNDGSKERLMPTRSGLAVTQHFETKNTFGYSCRGQLTLPGMVLTAEPNSVHVFTTKDLRTWLNPHSDNTRSSTVILDFSWCGEVGDTPDRNMTIYTVVAITPRGLIINKPYQGPAIVDGYPKVVLRTNVVPCPSPMDDLYYFKDVYTVPFIQQDERVKAMAGHPTHPYLIAGREDGSLRVFTCNKRPETKHSHSLLAVEEQKE